MERKVQISHVLPAPTPHSPAVDIPHQSGTFVTTDEPARRIIITQSL